MYYVREKGKQFGRLIYISKDDACIDEFVQVLDAYWLGELDSELHYLRLCWERDELPPAEARAFGGEEIKV